jgi:glycosyltransferase involved in cell wall biosynthesis
LLRRLRTLDVDIILQDELNHPSLYRINNRLASPPKRIAIIHHLLASEAQPGWKKGLFSRVEHQYLSSMDGFIFNSMTTRAAVEAQTLNANTSLKNSIIAYPGGDRLNPEIAIEEIRGRAADTGPLRLIFLGNLIPRKGLHTLLQALSYLEPGACKLTVIGSPAFNPNYARYVMLQAAQLNLVTSVLFVNYLEDAELVLQLRRSHVLVVPSTYEGYGMAYLEGMGFGLPAIATTSGAASEIITTGRNGFLVPPNDATALAEVIASLADDRQSLLKMSLSALRRYQTQPSWSATAQKIRKFLLENIDQR